MMDEKVRDFLKNAFMVSDVYKLFKVLICNSVQYYVYGARSLVIRSLLFFSSFAISSTSFSFQEDPNNNNLNSRPYLFTKSCNNLGSWTQNALNHTNTLREITLQLRDTPECKALSQNLQASLTQVNQQLVEIENEKNSSGAQDYNSNNSLGSEIQALRQSIAESTNGGLFGAEVSKTLLGSILNWSSASSLTPGTTKESRREQLKNFSERLKAVSNRGFSLFNQTIDSMLMQQNCLTDSNAAGQMFATSVSLLSAFMSSGLDPLGSQTAAAISKLSQFKRDLKYAKIIEQLNRQDFLNSIQCVMESTAETYCSARDNRYLFNEMKSQLSSRVSQTKDKNDKVSPAGISFDNPLYGYYILSQFSPLVTDWLFRVQIGSEPKILEDGMYQVRILTNMQQFLISTRQIMAAFNQAVVDLKSAPDLESKQTKALQMVIDISNQLLTSGGDPRAGGTGEHFYSKAGTDIEVAFKLIGLPIPEEVIKQGTLLPPDEYLSRHYKKMPIFSNPDAIPGIIKNNLNTLIDFATRQSNAYYIQRFIADPAVLISQTYYGFPFSIKFALYNIDKYLAVVTKKFENHNQYKSMIGMIIDLRRRLGKIFYRFNELAKFVEENKSIIQQSVTKEKEIYFKTEYIKRINAVMEEVYGQFNMQVSKSSFLESRLTVIVQTDFQINIENSLSSSASNSQLFKEIAYTSGKILYERLLEISGSDFAKTTADFDKAMYTFRENFMAQSELFSDPLVGMLSRIRLSAKNNSVTTVNVTDDSLKRSFLDGIGITPTTRHNSALFRFGRGVTNSLKALFGFDSIKYPINYQNFLFFNSYTLYSSDDEFHSAKNLFDRLCIQSLALRTHPSIYNLCKYVTLQSELKPAQLDAEAQKKFNDYLNVNYDQKLRADYEQNPGLNMSNRICAYRDFNRRNNVTYLMMNYKNPEANEALDSNNPFQYTSGEEDPVPTTNETIETKPDDIQPKSNIQPDLNEQGDLVIPVKPSTRKKTPAKKTHNKGAG